MSKIVENPFCCSHFGAKAVDLLIRDREFPMEKILIQTALARLVSTVVFPILASIDIFIYSIPTFVVSLAAPFNNRASIIAKKYFFMICKLSLGVATSPLGLLSPDLVTYHFLPKQHSPKKQIKDFGQIYSATVADVEMPTSIKEIQDLVKKAKVNRQKIGVGGTQLAQGGHTLPSESQSMFISMRQLNYVEIDAKNKIAKVGAGAIWQDVQKAAIQAGLAIQVMQASNMFSIGGALSTNVHGWDHRMGSLVHTIKTITIVDADGNVKKLARESGNLEEKKLFNSIIGGYGLFGIIVEAELELTNDEVLRSKEKLSPLIIMLNILTRISEAKMRSLYIMADYLLIQPIFLRR